MEYKIVNMIKFTSRFPFIEFVKTTTVQGKIVYEKHEMGGDTLDARMQTIVSQNKKMLLEHGVPINKVRFVYQPSFTYDIDKNVVNPKYVTMIPINNATGLFVKGEPVIEMGKPENLITINVDSYKTEDNYEFLKQEIKRNKRGIVIFIVDEMVNGYFTGEPQPYKFNVDTEVIRFANLDEKIKQHQKN